MKTESLYARMRRNPVAIAAGAGIAGILCGALIAGSVPNSAPKRDQVAFNKSVETTGSAPRETTGSAPHDVETTGSIPQHAGMGQANPQQEVATTSCEEQTWPYISRPCNAPADTGGKQKKIRVISTDKLADPIVTAVTPRAKEPAPAPAVKAPQIATTPPAPAPATQPAPVASAPVTAPTAETAGAPPAPSASVAFAPPATTPAAITPPPGAVTAAAPAQAQPAPETKRPPGSAAPSAEPNVTVTQRAVPEPRRTSSESRRAVTEEPYSRKRKAKSPRVKPEEIEQTDEQPRSRVVERDATPQRRVVERWTEREYQVPSFDGSTQRRRVIVVRPAESNPGEVSWRF